MPGGGAGEGGREKEKGVWSRGMTVGKQNNESGRWTPTHM